MAAPRDIGRLVSLAVVLLVGAAFLGCGADGSTCEEEADCSGGICEAGMCTTECTCDGDGCGETGAIGPSDDCESGWLCSKTDAIFKPIYHCEPTCKTDADCPEARPKCNVDRCQ